MAARFDRFARVACLGALACALACATGEEPTTHSEPAEAAAQAEAAETAQAGAAPASDAPSSHKRPRLIWAAVDVPAPAVYDAEAAHTLYISHCTSCHGLDGRGDGPAAKLMRAPPRDFADGLFKLRTRTGYPDPADLYRSVSAGFLSAGMPAYGHLEPSERWQLVEHISALGRAGFVRDALDELTGDEGAPAVPEFATQAATGFLDGVVGAEWPQALRDQLGDDELVAIELELQEDEQLRVDPGERVELSPSPSVDDALLAHGAELYVQWGCVRCHGDEGRGDGPSADTLVDNRGRPLAALELRSRAERYKGGAQPGDIARTLATGMSGTPMPAYRLGPESDADLWALAHFVAAWADG